MVNDCVSKNVWRVVEFDDLKNRMCLFEFFDYGNKCASFRVWNVVDKSFTWIHKHRYVKLKCIDSEGYCHIEKILEQDFVKRNFMLLNNYCGMKVCYD
jgi:hypothetical protein